MHLFILGIVLGVGLVLAYQEVKFEFWLIRQDKIKAAENAAIALVNAGYCSNGCHWTQSAHDDEQQAAGLVGWTSTGNGHSTPDTDR